MPGTDLSKLSRSIPADAAEFARRINQFSSPQVLDSAAAVERTQKKVAGLLSEWLGTVSSKVAAGRQYLETRSGKQLQRQEAEDLLQILQKLRTMLNYHLLGAKSTFAEYWPDEHENLRGQTEDLNRRWEDAIDAVNPYCELLRFRDDHPGLGMDDLSKARQHNREIQQDSREIIRRFNGYSQILLAMLDEVAALLDGQAGTTES
jgi:DNA repair exonuclease SbcCD ATPase subunit